MPIALPDFKIAALKCLQMHGLTAHEAIFKLMKMPRGATITFKGAEDEYSYNIIGLSVNLELWARRNAEPDSYEIAFYSDH
jgi:hypothetical protein